MSPIPQLAEEAIEKRWIGWYDDDYGSNGWYTWGRWVLLGIIIGCAVLFVLFLQCATCRRVRHGQQPIHGTAWMVPPSYYQSEQQYQNDPLPLYKAEPGEGDAARYNGNEFVPVDNEGQYSQYAPPEGPPPARTGPPHGPPPSHSGPTPTSSSAAYYRPPEGPPPGRTDVEAPEPAKYKN